MKKIVFFNKVVVVIFIGGLEFRVGIYFVMESGFVLFLFITDKFFLFLGDLGVEIVWYIVNKFVL